MGMQKFDAVLARWNVRLERTEARFGLMGAALVVALVVLAGGALYGGLSFLPYNFGTNYAAVSKAPFDFSQPNEVQYRLLGPVLGYVLHLRGNLFPILTHSASLLLLLTLYYHYRRRAWAPIEALGVTALMGFSFPVLNELHGAGRVDPLMYLFLLWAMIAVRRPFIYWACGTLALLTHESCAFALPGLFLLRFCWPATRGALVVHTLATVLMFLPWGVCRLILQSHMASDVPYTVEFYFNVGNMVGNLSRIAGTFWIGFCGAFKLAWLLPAYAIVRLWSEPGARPRAWLLLVMIAAPVAQCFVAEDVTRMLCLAFPAILLGAEGVRTRWPQPHFVRMLWLLLFINLLIPTTGVAGNRVTLYHSLPTYMFVQVVFGVPLP